MAEVQKDQESGENAQRFIEFVMMHAQQAALCLGQIPHPQTGEPEVHLDVARIFIDQLVMIRAKTRGNLSNEELGVLNNAISSLQMAFVEVSRNAPEGAAGGEVEDQQPESSESGTSGTGTIGGSAAQPDAPSGEEDGGRKRFTKSYGS